MNSAFVMPAFSAKAESVSYSSEVSVALTVYGRLQLIIHAPGKQSESVRPPIQNRYEIAFLLGATDVAPIFSDAVASLREMKANFISNFIAV